MHVNNFGENVRLKYALGIPEMKLLCKINPEGDVLLAEQSIEEIIDNVTLGDHVGAFCVSGPGAGQGSQLGSAGTCMRPGEGKACTGILQHRL